ncbi:hypothetical protein COO60DRAFT_1460331 [Scenedesmus sp. NREL 46B-D3]|nr:hypothetical protein COO60DRAFT_1460331 [Scenedesmus sp. NREL 46B-D3]
MQCNLSRAVFVLLMSMALLATSAQGRELLQDRLDGCGQGPVTCFADTLSASGWVEQDFAIHCIKSDWAARDTMARDHGTSDNGRFSFPGNMNGRWFCTYKDSS